MTSFGVYPLAAQARSTLTDVTLATAATYLPYVPAKKGPYGSSIPARTKISWVWPLIDQPLLSQPGQAACEGAQAQTLAASLGRGGLPASSSQQARMARAPQSPGRSTRPCWPM